ncbi:methionine permease [Phlyctema vagabunda]|uniref:Methionine permease n=1 Tax=Phlyctema vagabunda TaxID=108571 RepID=A0ABR4PDP3_9HELO
MEVLSSSTGQVVKASFECLDAPDHVTRIYEGDREPTIPGTPLNPTYTKISDIPLQDLRGEEDELELARNGFQYLKLAPKSYVHPDEDDNINSYLVEVTELVKAELKADEVICYDYRFRKNQPKLSKDSIYGVDGRKNWDPVSNKPHIDQTADGAPRRMRRHLTAEEAAQYLDGTDTYRLQIINAWKPLVHPVQDNPITLCDYFSTKKSDLVTIEYHPTPDYAGEYYALRHNKDQRWYWLSNQTADEMLLFLSYDSHPPHGLKYCPHTAFLNPLAPKNAPPRESIEARMIVITRIDGGE